MKNYKTGLMIFLILAIIISLFPPFEMSRPQTQIIYNYWKEYAFLFSERPPDYVKIKLLSGELVVEYLLAGFIALLIQLILTLVKKK